MMININNDYNVYLQEGIRDFLNNKEKNWIYVVDNKLTINNADILLEISEENKNLETVRFIYEKFLDYKIDRINTIVFAIGGGCLLDIVGYACATFMRGIKVVYIPTTLLAMVDAAIGGKNGVNFQDFKNYIGTFKNPQAIVIDPNFLETLSTRQFNNGMAEVIKYGAIYDFQFLTDLYEDKLTIDEIIQKSIEIKAYFIKDDFQDFGKRQALNFGHTFGHAIESYYNFKKYLHGEAISIGMNMIYDDPFLKKICCKYQLPIALDEQIDLEEFIIKDKKNNGNIKFITLKKLGKVDV